VSYIKRGKTPILAAARSRQSLVSKGIAQLERAPTESYQVSTPFVAFDLHRRTCHVPGPLRLALPSLLAFPTFPLRARLVLCTRADNVARTPTPATSSKTPNCTVREHPRLHVVRSAQAGFSDATPPTIMISNIFRTLPQERSRR
jgi:hypothetical protein